MSKTFLGLSLAVSSVLMVSCSSSSNGIDQTALSDATRDIVDESTGDTSSVTTTELTESELTESELTDSELTEGDLTEGSSTDELAVNNVFVEAPAGEFGNSVMGIIGAQPDLTLFESAILNADEDLALTIHNANNTWTVFAPNDTAMEGINSDRTAVLQHIHAGFQDRNGLLGIVSSALPMTSGEVQTITIAEDGVTLQIGGANIVQGPIVGDNGIVYKIDGVLQ